MPVFGRSLPSSASRSDRVSRFQADAIKTRSKVSVVTTGRKNDSKRGGGPADQLCECRVDRSELAGPRGPVQAQGCRDRRSRSVVGVHPPFLFGVVDDIATDRNVVQFALVGRFTAVGLFPQRDLCQFVGRR